MKQIETFEEFLDFYIKSIEAVMSSKGIAMTAENAMAAAISWPAFFKDDDLYIISRPPSAEGGMDIPPFLADAIPLNMAAIWLSRYGRRKH